jgi:NAD(P)-dependent dehydrogenase (short-subunit alcohol dehydrogenase family)
MMLQGLYRWLEHVPGRLRLRDKTCLIVGAGTDVTATIARVFAAEGCKILAVDENDQIIRILVNLIQEEGGFAKSFHATIRDTEQLERILSNRQFPQPDILIDNWSARPAPVDGLFTLQPVLVDSENCDPCRNSLHVLVAESADAMPNALSNPGSPTFGTSLAGIFARILAKTAAANWIRVNTVCFKHKPKPISSEYLIADDTRPAIDHQPNVTKPSLTLQIAYAALFLASDEATLVNDTSIFINDDASDGKAL